VIINKRCHTNIINVSQSIFECHDVILNDIKNLQLDLRNMVVVYSNMYHKIIIEQYKISNQDFSLVPSILETLRIILEIMSNLCSKSTFVMK
jgi:hypothetical protein